VFDILAGLVPTKSELIEKYINDSLGSYKYLYYVYLDNYHLRPMSLDELVNGLNYVSIKRSIKELYQDE